MSGQTERYFVIGKVSGAHGVRGTIKVYPTTDDPKRFELLDSVLLASVSDKDRDKKIAFDIEKVAYHKGLVLLNLKGISNMNDALALRGYELLVPESQALPLDEGEYYIRDLYDMTVLDTSGNKLGVLTDILSTGAHDVYVITNDKSEILVPAVKQYIKTVDVTNKRMVVIELVES